MSETQERKRHRQVNVPMPESDHAELERRAAEERISKSAHIRRLIAKDADSHPATGDRVAA